MIDALNSEEESWTLKKGDEDEVEKLLAEAETIIPAERSGTKQENAETAPDWFRGDISGDDGGDTDAEADILRMIKDEIDFEVAHGIVSAEEDVEGSGGNEGFKSPEPDIDPDEYLLERFGALGGITLPPVPKSEPGVNIRPKLPVAVAESDTWCCGFPHLVSPILSVQDSNSTP